MIIFGIEYFVTDDLTDELVDMLMAQVLETEAVGEGLADWLESEGGVDITQGESLAVHGADGDSPVLVTVLGQLRDVGGHISLIIVLHPQIFLSCYARQIDSW